MARDVSQFNQLLIGAGILSSDKPYLIEMSKEAALFHDYGKIINEEILNRVSLPRKLSGREFEIVADHTVVGREVLAKLGVPEPVLDAVIWHHRGYNGSGYPAGNDNLKGDKIPPLARITAVLDTFDALTGSERKYNGGPKSVAEALGVMKGLAGIKLDPLIVELFIRLKTPSPVLSVAASPVAKPGAASPLSQQQKDVTSVTSSVTQPQPEDGGYIRETINGITIEIPPEDKHLLEPIRTLITRMGFAFFPLYLIMSTNGIGFEDLFEKYNSVLDAYVIPQEIMGMVTGKREVYAYNLAGFVFYHATYGIYVRKRRQRSQASLGTRTKA